MGRRFGILVRCIVWSGLGLGILFLLSPSEAQIRMDCGDLRWVRWGIVPVEHRRMTEPERRELISAARRSAILRAKWLPVFQDHTSYQQAGAYYDWYRRAAHFAGSDETLCRLMVEELAEKIERARGLSHVVPGWLKGGWQQRRGAGGGGSNGL